MTDKMTDDEHEGVCLMLACLGILLAFSLFAVCVTLIIVVARGGVPGC